MNVVIKRAQSLIAVASLTMVLPLVACAKKDASNAQASSGALDTTAATSAVQAEGPGVHVTRTDSKSVDKAGEYKLTADNFGKFVAAADSLAALSNRDSTARAFLAQDLTDAGSTDVDAGLKWLESNAAVSNAINSAGISTRDYFVQAIAIASAEQFIGNPNAAPPTPSTKENAEFLRGQDARLKHLQSLRSGRTGVTATP